MAACMLEKQVRKALKSQDRAELQRSSYVRLQDTDQGTIAYHIPPPNHGPATSEQSQGEVLVLLHQIQHHFHHSLLLLDLFYNVWMSKKAGKCAIQRSTLMT